MSTKKGHDAQKAPHAWRIRIILPVLLALILLCIGTLRYISPAWAVQGFMSDLSHGHWSVAQAAFCHSQDGNEIQNRLGSWYQADLSHITFTVSAESLLDAHVRTQGSVTLNPDDSSIVLSWKAQIALQARGFSWCIASDYLTIDGISEHIAPFRHAFDETVTTQQ
jgi:hypothetical protein